MDVYEKNEFECNDLLITLNCILASVEQLNCKLLTSETHHL